MLLTHAQVKAWSFSLSCTLHLPLKIKEQEILENITIHHCYLCNILVLGLLSHSNTSYRVEDFRLLISSRLLHTINIWNTHEITPFGKATSSLILIDYETEIRESFRYDTSINNNWGAAKT